METTHRPANQAASTVERSDVAASAECQVCGDRLVGELVRCPVCETPHHHDCWNYLGRCSTYGCAKASSTLPTRPARAMPYTGLQAGRYLPEALLGEDGVVTWFTSEGRMVELEKGEVALQIPSRMLPELPLTHRQRRAGALVGFATVLLCVALARGQYLSDLGAVMLCVASLLVEALLKRRIRPAGRLAWLVRTSDGTLCVQTGDTLSPKADRLIGQVREPFEARALIAQITVPRIPKVSSRVRLCLCVDYHRRDEEEWRPLLDLVEPWSGNVDSDPAARDRLKAVRSLGVRLSLFFDVPFLESEEEGAFLHGPWPEQKTGRS